MKAGERAPSFRLPDTSGKIVRSDDLLRCGPMVLTFYRGSWCPYCNLDLQALQAAYADITSSGGSLVSVSQQTLQNSLIARETNRVTFSHAERQGRRARSCLRHSFGTSGGFAGCFQGNGHRSSRLERRGQLDPADAIPLRHRAGRRHRLRRGQSRPHPASRAERVAPHTQEARAPTAHLTAGRQTSPCA